jgi:hypothetical protein
LTSCRLTQVNHRSTCTWPNRALKKSRRPIPSPPPPQKKKAASFMNSPACKRGIWFRNPTPFSKDAYQSSGSSAGVSASAISLSERSAHSLSLSVSCLSLYRCSGPAYWGVGRLTGRIGLANAAVAPLSCLPSLPVISTLCQAL